jgi:hypothetical protein
MANGRTPPVSVNTLTGASGEWNTLDFRNSWIANCVEYCAALLPPKYRQRSSQEAVW